MSNAVIRTATSTCPVCKLAIHASQGVGGGILIQSSIGTFSGCHSHVICECEWWAQTDTIEAAHKLADDHFARFHCGSDGEGD